jgi:putative MATE family efflux protein
MNVTNRKGIIASFIDGLYTQKNGDSYIKILRLFLPEFITGLVLYSLLNLLDAKFVANLSSTATYATLGTTNTLLHWLIKMGEALSVGVVIVAGSYNGAKEYKKVGAVVTDAFWITTIVGSILAAALFFCAPWIYYWYGVPEQMIHLGIPYMRLRALSVLLMFWYLAAVGFLRAIKNTQTPMQIFALGAIAFIVSDYLLIFGKFGCPECGLNGSAWASIIQYLVMLIAVVGYIMHSQECRKYAISLLRSISDYNDVKRLLNLSWPVVIDKSTMALAYIWLGGMINHLGQDAIASYHVIKDMERFAFLPAIAFAQVATLLASNQLGEGDWHAIKSNIKKIMLMSSLGVGFVLLVFSIYPHTVISFFDQEGTFTTFASIVFPALSVLVFFDLLQLILAASLRGVGNVRLVMMTRLAICGLYFSPIAYCIAQAPIESALIKFYLLYSSFYIGNGLMSLVYLYQFRSGKWKEGLITPEESSNVKTHA